MNTTQNAGSQRSAEVYGSLSHSYRREILTELYRREHSEGFPIPVDELVKEDLGPRGISLELYHHHLPRLADAGFIRWDKEVNVVRRGPRFDDAASIIELMVDDREELPEGYL